MPTAGAPDADAPIAAIDLGTNSFHLVIARPAGNNRFEVIDREKEVVRLGSGAGDMKRLAPDAIERGIATLTRFARLAEAAGAEVRAVATSAVREASNRDEFVRRARDEAGVDVEVVTGAEEARLIHLGVVQSVPVFDQRAVVVDIGGGSTEVVLAEAETLLVARSVKVGAIRITERFLGREPLKKADLADARAYLRVALAPVARAVADAGGFDVAVGSSGTIIAVAEMARAAHGLEALRSVANAGFDAADLAGVVDELASRRTAAERLEVPGLDPGRADIILGGVLVLEAAFRVLGIDGMVVSDAALREGVLLDTVRRRHAVSLGHLADLRAESVRHLAALTPGEQAHAGRVAELCLQLFDATARWHGLDAHAEELLEAAALLCNVGQAVSHERHHLHSYYVIRNTDALTGFTEHEVELIALVARYHRKSTPKDRHPEFARLAPDDQKLVSILAGILRIAVGLDRGRDGAVSTVRVAKDGKGRARVEVVAVDGRDVELELFAAAARRDLLESALGLELEVVAA